MSLVLGNKGENGVTSDQWLQNITGQQMSPQQENLWTFHILDDKLKEYHICIDR